MHLQCGYELGLFLQDPADRGPTELDAPLRAEMLSDSVMFDSWVLVRIHTDILLLLHVQVQTLCALAMSGLVGLFIVATLESFRNSCI